MDYKAAGVDREKADVFVDRIKGFIGKTYNQNVINGVGGFAALYKISEDRMLASGTDGVGTKVKLAQELNIHHTIGQDLVGMCVNDVLCTGARPMFFLDYLATGKLELDIHAKIVKGISNACLESSCALIGGETAEMPGVYANGIYDLAGFCVGDLPMNRWLNPNRVKLGDSLIGVSSTGFHSNGFSLIRKLVGDNEDELKRALLTPTRLYTKMVDVILNDQFENISGIAHITGSGFENIPRINENYNYVIQNLPSKNFREDFMNEIINRSKLSIAELYRTFNMGIGMVISCRDPEKLLAKLDQLNEKCMVLGKIESGSGDLILN